MHLGNALMEHSYVISSRVSFQVCPYTDWTDTHPMTEVAARVTENENSQREALSTKSDSLI